MAPSSKVLGGFLIGGHYHLDGFICEEYFYLFYSLLFVKNTMEKKNKKCQWSPG